MGGATRGATPGNTTPGSTTRPAQVMARALASGSTIGARPPARSWEDPARGHLALLTRSPTAARGAPRASGGPSRPPAGADGAPRVRPSSASSSFASAISIGQHDPLPLPPPWLLPGFRTRCVGPGRRGMRCNQCSSFVYLLVLPTFRPGSSFAFLFVLPNGHPGLLAPRSSWAAGRSHCNQGRSVLPLPEAPGGGRSGAGPRGAGAHCRALRWPRRQQPCTGVEGRATPRRREPRVPVGRSLIHPASEIQVSAPPALPPAAPSVAPTHRHPRCERGGRR